MAYNNFLQNLRNKVIKKDKKKGLQVLLANFEQTTLSKYQFFKVFKEFYRRKVNVKGLCKEYMELKGKKPVDTLDNQKVIGELSGDGVFDMSSWAIKKVGIGKFTDYITPFIYQIKACNFNCPYCYVNDENKNAREDNGGRFISIRKVVDDFEEFRGEKLLHIIRPSGGEPTLAVEQWLELIRELEKRRINDVYVRSDTNLSTGHFLEKLETHGEIEKNLLEKVADFGKFGLLCSFKGTDTRNFVDNTGALPELFEEQFYSFKKYIKAGIDAYPFLYNPNPSTIESFLERLSSEVSDNVYLKTWIFPIKLYESEKVRLRKRGIDPEAYIKKAEENFIQSKEKMQAIIQKRYGINYKLFSREGIELKVKK